MTDSHDGEQAGSRLLRLCHRAVPAELRAIRLRVSAWAHHAGLPEDVLVDLQLALGEAVANGVEHAYAAIEPGTVDVDLEIRRSAEHRVVAVRVVDYGRWRPAIGRDRFRGRGLLMIEGLAERVEVSVTPTGTQVRFEIPLAA